MEGLYKKIIKGEYSPIPRTFSLDLQSIIAGLLQVNPRNRLTCSQILALPSSTRHMSVPSIEPELSLLSTIKFPKHFQLITKNLPQPTYQERKPVRNRSTIMPQIRKDSILIRDSSESKYKKSQRENPESSKYSKKNLLKENYKIVRIQHSRKNYKKSSAKSLVPKVDVSRNESLSRKPSTNRSLLPAY